MATLRELKTRIGSVASSEKITGAMKMISSAKVHKNMQALQRLNPFKEQISSIMAHVLAAGVNFTSPLIEVREVERVALVVYGSDDGLCGAYNINIYKQLLNQIEKLQERYGKSVNITIIPVGSKICKACLKAKDKNVSVKPEAGIDSKMSSATVDRFTDSLRTSFLNKEYDLVEVVYMKFHSMSRQRLAVDTLFPVSAETLLSDSGKKTDNKLYIFEPDPNSIFNEILPMFALSTMQEITIENRASEQAARVMAMQSANDNAKKLLEELQLEYNKLRQQGITTELLDILGGQTQR